VARVRTGSIHRLKSGKWFARYTSPDGSRHGKAFLTKRDALAWLQQIYSDISSGKFAPSDALVVITFGGYAKRWLVNRKVKGRPLAERTLSNYRDLLDRFILGTFGGKPIHTITRDQVEKWYDRTAVDSPTYRARAYSLLRSMLASAVDDGYLVVNPARIRGAGQAKRRHKVQPATLSELQMITEAMPPRYRLMVQLAAWCALRFGELTELRRGDVDTKAGVLRIRRAVVLVDGRFVVKEPKSEAGVRDVNIPPHLLPMVREHLLTHCALGLDGLLLPSRNNPEGAPEAERVDARLLPST
jgi:integrase